MKLVPKYSYEFNWALNETLSESGHIQNFASLLSDKERFFGVLGQFMANEELLEKRLGYKLPERVEFFVVRAEKFKSFSEPITIEYSIAPEEMAMFLLKEIVKTVAVDRFPDEVTREQVINAFLIHLFLEGKWESNFKAHYASLHNESERMYPRYQYKDIDFSKTTLKEVIFSLYE